MKNKIIAAFETDKLDHKENITYPKIHVIDRILTDGSHGVEIYNTKPKEDTLLIENSLNLDISAIFFKPQCFKDKQGNEPKSCEGVFYLSDSTDKTWVLFLEIKDCKSKNITNYFKEAKEQIISTVQIFRDKKIISKNKRVYGNISFPRKNKTDFYNQLIKPWEPKIFIDKYSIVIRGTNHLKIKNRTAIY